MWAVGLLLAITVLVAAPIGFLIAAVLSRELEGALALLVVVSMQMLADPAGSIAPWLPFWSTRERPILPYLQALPMPLSGRRVVTSMRFVVLSGRRR